MPVSKPDQAPLAGRAGPAERVENHLRLDAIAAEWDALATRLGSAPWDRPDWISAWQAAFGSGEPRVLTLHRGENLAAVLPLERVGGALRAPTNAHTPSFAGVFADRDAAVTLARAALTQTGRRLEFSMLDGGSPLALAIGGLPAEPPVLVHSRVTDRSPYLVLPDSVTGLEATLSKKRRGDIRRLRRRLAELGEVSFEVVADDGQLDEQLDEGFAVERSGWKGQRGTAISSQRATRMFYSDIARRLAGRGWLRLAFLRVEGRAVAFDLGAQLNGVHYLIKTGYDEALRSLSPGLVLRHEMLTRCIEAGCTTYEFLGSDAAWKRIWTETSHDRLQMHVFPTGWRNRAEWAIVAGALPLARRVRDRAAAIRATEGQRRWPRSWFARG